MSSPPLSSRRLALLSVLTLFGVLGFASICSADSPWRRRFRSAPTPPYRVTVEDRYGEPLPAFRKGDERYVLGEAGERYNVRIDNPTPERVEVVLSVDGRDAISGEEGDYVTQRGYLIEPYGSVLVEGFRRSLNEVATFRFTDRASSYSARRGTVQHVGVIGAAFFPEKPRPKGAVGQPSPRRTYEEERDDAPRAERRRDGAGPTKQAPARTPAPSQPPRDEFLYEAEGASPRRRGGPSNIGTQYGEESASGVVEVAFERRSPSHPAALVRVRYDDYDGLLERGIDVPALGYVARGTSTEPNPFPRSPRRFAPPP